MKHHFSIHTMSGKYNFSTHIMQVGQTETPPLAHQVHIKYAKSALFSNEQSFLTL